MSGSSRLKSFAILDIGSIIFLALDSYLFFTNVISFGLFMSSLIIAAVVVFALAVTIKYYFNKKAVPVSRLG